MKFTDVSVRLMQRDDSKLKAVASVTFDDCFVVHDIKVLEGTQGNFVVMPSRKLPDGTRKDVAHPLNTETREALKQLVLDAYDKALKEQPLE